MSSFDITNIFQWQKGNFNDTGNNFLLYLPGINKLVSVLEESIEYSDDGITWIKVNVINLNRSYYPENVVWINEKNILVILFHSTISTYVDYDIYAVSSNLINWTTTTKRIYPMNNPIAIYISNFQKFYSNMFSINYIGSHNSLFESLDGVNWTIKTLTHNARKIEYFSFINTLATFGSEYSKDLNITVDGIIWTTVTLTIYPISILSCPKLNIFIVSEFKKSLIRKNMPVWKSTARSEGLMRKYWNFFCIRYLNEKIFCFSCCCSFFL